METCVLLPAELSVVLRPFSYRRRGVPAVPTTPKPRDHHRPSPPPPTPATTPASSRRRELHPRVHRRGLRPASASPGSPASSPCPPSPHTPVSPPVNATTSSPEVEAVGDDDDEGFLEMGATVWANVRLLPGTTFTPDQGSVRLETLEIYRKLRADDVRYQYGLFDEIHIIDDEEVRHCNWVRFLRTSRDVTKVNMVAVKVGGHVFYQVVSTIPPNGELNVYFDESQQSISCSITDTILRKERQSVRESQGLSPSESQGVSPPQREFHGLSPGEFHGISPPTSSSKTPSRSPESTRSLGAHSLMMTSPSDKEDDVRSTVSDVTTASEDSHQSHSAKSSFSSSFSSEARTPGPKVASPSPGRGHPTMECARLESSSILGISPPTTHPSPSATFSSPNMTSPANMTSPMTSPSGSVTSPSAFPGRSPEDYLRLPIKRNRERTWLPCDVCGKKFDRPSLLRRHMRTHTGEKPHACDVCGKAFSTSSSLNTHRRIHSGEKPHQCPICGKCFTASSNLYYHRMTHNKEKPHKCKLCAKSFPTPGDLKSHMYVHNGSWPYKCDICNRGFSKHTNLKNHLLLHTGDKPHECDLCGKRFALQCNLKTHTKTHEGEPQEECFKCGKLYLVSSRQVLNGYCRTCLQGATSGGHPAPHSTNPGPSPGPGGPSPGSGGGNGHHGQHGQTPRGPHSFSVESLATSSVHHRGMPPRDRGIPPPQESRGIPMHDATRGAPGAASALSMSGYAMFDTKPGVVTVAGVMPGRHHGAGNPMFTTYAGIPWPKLVPQQY